MKRDISIFLAVLTSVFVFLFLTNAISAPRVYLSQTNSEIKSQTVSNQVVQEKLSCDFPVNITKWESLITSYSHLNDIDPNLIASVILQESGGNPSAYSISGAVGLMQIMPNDGIAASFECGGNPCFINRPSMNSLYDPEFNISFGAKMLAGLIQDYGSIREALFHYGPIDMGYRYADLVLDIYKSCS